MQKLTLTLSALYLALVGLALMFVPLQFGIGAVPPDASPQLIALLRLLGGPLLGVAVLNWLSRNAKSVELHTILVANIAGFGAVAGNDLWAIATGEARELAKLFVVFHLLFTLAFIVLAQHSRRDRRLRADSGKASRLL
jgi:hypothetical protein